MRCDYALLIRLDDLLQHPVCRKKGQKSSLKNFFGNFKKVPVSARILQGRGAYNTGQKQRKKQQKNKATAIKGGKNYVWIHSACSNIDSNHGSRLRHRFCHSMYHRELKATNQVNLNINKTGLLDNNTSPPASRQGAMYYYFFVYIS